MAGSLTGHHAFVNVSIFISYQDTCNNCLYGTSIMSTSIHL